jgi:hypothetical protein
MIGPTIEQYIHWHKCLSEIAHILEFDKIVKAFYYGKRRKWGTPTCLLVVIEEDLNNRFIEDMCCEGGSTGSAYLVDKETGKCLTDSNPWGEENKKNTFHYKVITNRVYDQIKNDHNKLANDSWISGYGFEIDLDLMKRYYDAKAFA